ncbi:MAG: molybdenum cofactor biosynthesis protein MoaE [Verrucomicrobiales bacterium]|nr:molybdenum cofactor biosynthesis protein MoaE [Verrucomicrobiales bacterium]
MASSDFKVSISEQSVAEVEKTFSPSLQHGADLRFHGVVRDQEDDKIITGIDYSCYQDMAAAELQKIVDQMQSEHPDHLAHIHHRIGFVAAGDASILIRVQTAHSQAAFDLSREYLRRIKQTVPIWKKPIFA